MYNTNVEYALFRLRTTFYEEGEKASKLLSRQLKKQKSLNVIPVIKKGNNLVSSSKEINEVLKQFYRELYTSQVGQNQREISNFFSNITLPEVSAELVR